MKKIYSYFILPVITLFSLALHAQTTPYHKLLAPGVTDWYIFEVFIPVKPGAVKTSTVSFYPSGGKYSAFTDTTVLGNDYKKMYWMYQTPGPANPQHIGYIREDTIARKVYFLDKEGTAEDLLYDFSLTLGATTQLDFPGNSGSFPAGMYTVTNVDSVMTRVGYRKRFELLSPSSDALIYIESIGCVMHPLYLYSYFYQGGFFMGAGPTCHYDYDMGLACKESDNEKYYQSCTYTLAQMNGCIYKYDSCNYYSNCSNVKELDSFTEHRLIPNPASEKTTLELTMNKQMAATINLYNVSGQLVKEVYSDVLVKGKNTISIDLSSYKNGYFFLKVSGDEVLLRAPLIIAR